MLGKKAKDDVFTRRRMSISLAPQDGSIGKSSSNPRGGKVNGRMPVGVMRHCDTPMSGSVRSTDEPGVLSPKYKRGDPVTYVPFKGCSPDQYDRGIVKRVHEDGEHVFVLYHTKYKIFEEHDLDYYTAARTAISDLLPYKG